MAFDLIAGLPLGDNSVDCIVCDFPFGQKHQPYLAVKRSPDSHVSVKTKKRKMEEGKEYEVISCNAERIPDVLNKVETTDKHSVSNSNDERENSENLLQTDLLNTSQVTVESRDPVLVERTGNLLSQVLKECTRLVFV